MLWRETSGLVCVLVVHRPHYDDWSFPKGKHEPGESNLDCAVREVEEETGFAVVVGACLPDVDYIDHKGRPKTVNYWVMQIAEGSGEFSANEEVDEVRWLSVGDADALLTYELDRRLLHEFQLLRAERV